jgi:Uma2 family endonuclease
MGMAKEALAMDGSEGGLLERNPWVPRRKLDTTDYHRMGEMGIFAEGDRVELIEGEIIAMVPIGFPHSGAVNAMTHRFVQAVGDRAVVSVQNPMPMSEFNEPQPDLVLFRPREDFYRGRAATLADVLLAVEVADSSLRYDQAVKLPLYARFGVPEVWIVNLRAKRVEVHRDPSGETYGTVIHRVAGEMLEPALLPGVRIAASEVIG